MTRAATGARGRFARHLEHHLDAQAAGEGPASQLPRGAPIGAADLEGDVAPLAVALVAVWNDARAGLAVLEPLLVTDLPPDPLVEPLLRWGVCLAEMAADSALAARYRATLARYRVRFGRAHALADLQAALTDLALDTSAGWRPYAASGVAEPDGAVAIRLLRLRDPVSARFDRTPARLAEIDRRGGASEFVIELEGDAALLRELDPEEIVMRFVWDDRYLEVSTADGDLFDVEINEREARLYGRLRRAPERWDGIESAVVMPP